MGKKERLFRFKQFSVAHAKSAMKVGVDGVMVGAWADLRGASVIMDVGCGCGMIALMCAQRNPRARVLGVDVHQPSVEESLSNAAMSPWSDRVAFLQRDFMDYRSMEVFAADMRVLCGDDAPRGIDHIVSNPPYFDAGVSDPTSDREISRHAADFGPLSIISVGARLLSPGGRISMITPPEWETRIAAAAKGSGISLSRITRVYSKPTPSPKRILVELTKPADGSEEKYASQSAPECLVDDLYMEVPGEGDAMVFSPEYKRLCADFYLRF